MDKRFTNLKSFYTSQLAEPSSSGHSLDLSGGNGYGSPGTLSRIMGLYTDLGGYGAKKAQVKGGSMREAQSIEEGIQLLGDEDAMIRKMQEVGWEGSELEDDLI